MASKQGKCIIACMSIVKIKVSSLVKFAFDSKSHAFDHGH